MYVPMASCKVITVAISRNFTLSSSCSGKKNFRKFILHSRGTKDFRERQKFDKSLPRPFNYGVRSTGYMHGDKFIEVPEMIPEIVIPDLTGFKLKPYVSYKVQDISQSEFTAQDLFISIYRDKIANDFKEAKLNGDGSPKEPSPEEALTKEEAKLKVRQTGSDIYEPMTPRQIRDYPLRY